MALLLRALCLLLALALAGQGAALAGAPADGVPAHGGRFVVDQARLLPQSDRAALEAELADYAARTGNQVVVLTVPGLGGEAVGAFANRVARAWGIGQKDRNNGVLILVAKAEGRVRFEVGRGVEDRLPDLLAARIQREVMVPEFRQGRFGPGLRQGAAAVMQALGGAPAAAGTDAQAAPPPVPPPAKAPAGDGPPLAFTGVLVLIFLLLALGLVWRRHGENYRSGHQEDYSFLMGLLLGLLSGLFRGRGGGFGGGMGGGLGGGGGGFSGGGGDFGGGGADSDFGGGDGGGND